MEEEEEEEEEEDEEEEEEEEEIFFSKFNEFQFEVNIKRGGKNQFTLRNLITGTIDSVSGLQNEAYEHTDTTPVFYIRFQQRQIRMAEC
jgi:hypothetical protein